MSETHDPSDPSDLPFSGRLIGKVLDSYTHWLGKYRMPHTPELIRALGPVGVMRYANYTDRTINIGTKRLGGYSCQFLIGMSGMWNGCRFCGVGHVLAANITMHHETGLLCPLDHRKVIDLQMMTDDEAIEEVARLLADDDFAELRRLVLRLCEMKIKGDSPKNEEDGLLDRIMRAWDWMNECSIVVGLDVGPDEVPPLSPIGKNQKAIDAYFAALDSSK